MDNATKCFFAALLCLSAHGVARAQAAPAAQTTMPPEFREMQQAEDRWDAAVTKRDQYGLELVLAPQFIGISASGDITTRNQEISRLFQKNANAEPESLAQKVVNVRFVGDVAIVNGTYVMTWKGEKAPFQEKGVFSHVFEHVHNTWLCLNSQQTVVSEGTKDAAATGQKAKAKRSDAALPMHIPLVYKGPDSAQTPPAGAKPANN